MPKGAYDLALLTQDLENLGTSSINLDRFRQIPHIVILHGAKDRIVSLKQGKNLAEQLPTHSQWIEIPDAGHALPFSHFQTCWSILNSMYGSYFS
ncbi:MAG: alpha/beta hydrolase [Leptolyngbyaceae cyanobacterium CRU_2_3]|nr:alpha/beta hydrolase [Leptolyngbyaceae cyanobacterium CRU_2_3]